MDHQALIQAYLDGELTAAQHAELSDWLDQSEANREAFVRASILDTQINRQLQNADLHRFLDQIDIHAIQEVIEQSSSDESGTFAAAMDAGSDSTKELTPAASDLTLARALGVLTRAGAEFAGQKVRQHAVPLGLAAAIALALTLFLIFQGDNATTPGPNLTQGPDETVIPVPRHAVAALTATHDAQWAEDFDYASPQAGDKLYAGRRLSLTQGFAEITTLSGAVAILEAPASIELMDSDNALRLHSGKLVGVCETDSSKGFLVRTPHMDITDLGTRFGVDVSASDTTEVHVYEGEVEVVHQSAGQPSQRLVKGQAIRVGAKANQTVQMDADTGIFAATTPVTIALPSTGTGLAVGEADPAWTVVSAAGQPLATAQALSVSAATGHIRHMPNDPNRSQWLAWVPERTPTADQTKYLVRTSIQVPEHLDPDSAYLTIHFAADNHLAGILVNGERIEIKVNEPRNDWRELERLQIKPGLKPGTNTIDFEILNFKPRFDLEGVGIEAGLRVEWQLHAKPKLFTR